MPDFAVTLTVHLDARDELDAAEKGWKIAAQVEKGERVTVPVDNARCDEVH